MNAHGIDREALQLSERKETCGFGHIYGRNLSYKTSFFCALVLIILCEELGLGSSSQNCSYFGVFEGSKLLNSCLVVWANKQMLRV